MSLRQSFQTLTIGSLVVVYPSNVSIVSV